MTFPLLYPAVAIFSLLLVGLLLTVIEFRQMSVRTASVRKRGLCTKEVSAEV
ncbi:MULTISPECIES: hypothetical protein [Burkholderiaceae]|jgi:hypothetical protein|uniref:Uncharacterized protein n=1 Tax=Caballeronia sordidicola TaxID=196367 RepID=A0A242N101_CABSO|nr:MULTISPECIES: hypothetical protein [Burkholderiaceae]MDP9155807.1 hypothetical protein [Pseudomonadota bacterium]OTP75274.1 hypothetical protein PAMC26577_13450 [Caballeronia sordidicola]OTP77360.1 hypothetical protein PAMC26510_09205 [Caballeronia sordidicola]